MRPYDLENTRERSIHKLALAEGKRRGLLAAARLIHQRLLVLRAYVTFTKLGEEEAVARRYQDTLLVETEKELRAEARRRKA